MAKKFLTSIDLCGNQLIKPIIENVASNPENNLAEGRLAFNTTDNLLIVHDGKDWKKIQYEIQPGTYMEVGKYPNLKAIENLTNVNGLLRKTGEDTWEIDTNTYLLSDGNALSATELKTPRSFSITGGATAEGVDFDGSAAVALNVTALDASKLTSTIPSEVLGRSTLHIGTTPIELNRPKGELELTGITSIELDNKAIIKYDENKNAIYIGKTGDGGAIDLYTEGEITSSNRLDKWGDYKESNTNWVLSAKLGNDLRLDLMNKSNVSHNHKLSDLLEKNYSSLEGKPKLGTAADKDVGTAEDNIPILGTDGKLDDSVIPKIAISDTSVVKTEVEMLALTAEIGDIAIRTDLSKSFILKGDNPKESSNWQELLTPTSSVESVAGKTGTVVLSKGDVGLGNVNNTSDANKPVSTAQGLALDKKVDKVAGKGLSSNDYTTDEKTKLDGIEVGANNYTHPENHPASIITQDAKNRFVTDEQIGAWNAKETTKDAQEKADNALNSAKSYVDGKVKTDVPKDAEFTDTVYTHPETHSALMITETDDRQFVTKAQKEAWSGNEQTIPKGKDDQYFRGDKTWQTLNTTVVPEGTNQYYTDARVKSYGDANYLAKDGTALKAEELKTARKFSIAGITGLSAEAISFEGSDDVNLELTGSLNVVNGGTGLTDAKGGFTRKVTGNLTTSATSYAITHGLGTDVIVQVIENSTNEVVECDIIMTSKDVATIMFNKAPIADTYRYIIIG